MEGYNIDDERVNDRVVNPIYKYAGSYAGWTHLNVPRSLSVFENSWAKLRELTLSYKVPEGVLTRTKVLNRLVYPSGEVTSNFDNWKAVTGGTGDKSVKPWFMP